MSYLCDAVCDVRTDLRQPTQNYLRAVICPPPSHFSVSPFLPTSKSNGKYHHGIHVFSNNQNDRSSNFTRRSLSEYDIWRSWEDCLWFQQTLEDEYERAAREKKTRLIQGKGVKGFNGMYKQDMASSWESLPPGPNPDSVALNIHKHLPLLTKRGTLFRASQATIDRRQAEFTSLIEALFSDNMPALIKEIRASTIISDFFGYWRRDYDYTEQSQKTKMVRRDSVTSSIFSSYFLPSNPTVPSLDTSPPNSPPIVPHKRSQPSATPRSLSFYSSTEISEEPRYPFESLTPKSRSRPHSASSDSSAQSESSSETSLISSTSPAILEDVPIVFGHNPSDLSNSILEVLPEEGEIGSKPPESYRQVRPKPRVSAMERKANRFCSIFGPSLNGSLCPAEKSGDRSVRESWQTTDSQDSAANDILGGLGLILPHQIKEQKFRASIASISTFMTTDSAEAVIPQTPTSATAYQSCSFTSRTSFSASSTPSDFDAYSDEESYDLSLPESPSSTCTAFKHPASETCSTLSSSAFSTTNSTSFPIDSICIKAIHTTSIILLRVSRGIGLSDVRQDIYNKFIIQEGISLSETYKIAFVPPNPTPPTSTSSQSVALTNRAGIQLITLDSDWEQLTSTLQGSKITLRILDIPSI